MFPFGRQMDIDDYEGIYQSRALSPLPVRIFLLGILLK